VKPQAEKTAKVPSIWMPDASLTNQLTNVSTVGNYQISLPSDFVQQPSGLILGSVQTSTWKGPAGAETPSLVLRITIQADDRGIDVARKDMRRFLEVFTASVADGSNIKIVRREKTETGTLDGLQFTRFRWAGSAEKDVPVSGFAYGAIDGTSSIIITALNFGSDTDRANKLTESVIATFKKK